MIRTTVHIATLTFTDTEKKEKSHCRITLIMS